MNELKGFNNLFGNLSILNIGGKEYFPATDVAKLLGYANPHKAIRDHCKERGIINRSVGVQTGFKKDGTPSMQQVNKKFIDEGNLYRLILNSKLPSAKKFESWVFDEVLPSIRKHGAYMTPDTIEQTLANSDFIIQLATQLKEEQQKRMAAEQNEVLNNNIKSEDF